MANESSKSSVSEVVLAFEVLLVSEMGEEVWAYAELPFDKEDRQHLRTLQDEGLVRNVRQITRTVDEWLS